MYLWTEAKFLESIVVAWYHPRIHVYDIEGTNASPTDSLLYRLCHSGFRMITPAMLASQATTTNNLLGITLDD